MTHSSDAEPLVTFEVVGDTLRVRDEQEGHRLDLRISGVGGRDAPRSLDASADATDATDAADATTTTDAADATDATDADELHVQPALPDLFPAPVDDAVSVSAEGIEIGAQTSTVLRDADGNHLCDFGTEPISYPRGTYYVEISAGVKTYVRVPDVALTGELDHYHDQDAPMCVEFDAPTTISIGARSLHSAPRATITLPDDPDAWIEAFPYLASSIKEFSPERSWPTLRGHPPAIERGDVLEIPEVLTKPETGVTVAVPPTFADLYRVAPLVYYLGADAVAADSPELRLANGYVEPLPEEGAALEARVVDLVSRCLLLDALVRNDGYHGLDALYEYDEIAGDLPFYPPALYDESLTTQLMEYLEVSTSVIEPHRPPFPLDVALRPDPTDVELLPTLLDDFAAIRVADSGTEEAGSSSTPAGGPVPQPTATTGHVREPGAASVVREAYERTNGRATPMAEEASIRFVLPEQWGATRNSDRDAWRDGSPEADRDAGRDDSPEADQEVDREADRELVSGDVVPDAEWDDVVTYLVRETDAPRERIEFRIGPTREEFAELLAADHTVVYSGLPAVDGGIECADGVLDPESLEEVGARSLLVQGPDSGGVADAVTTRGVEVAFTTTGTPSPWSVGHLLRAALRGHHAFHAARFAGGDDPAPYRVVGAPNRQIVRRPGDAAPIEIEFTAESAEEHHASVRFFPTDTLAPGSVSKLIEPFTRDAYTLIGRTIDQPLLCDAATVLDVLGDDDYVVWLDGTPYHGERELTTEILREQVEAARDRNNPRSTPRK